MSQLQDQQWKKSTCAYCGVGCGIKARNTAAGEMEIQGDDNHPVNFGQLCSKGMALGDTLIDRGRLLEPEVQGEPVSWDQALNSVADGLMKTINEHGPDSIALYLSGQLLTEDYYVANKLMKGFIGSANVDTNSRLCMASSVVGHKRAFGSDTVPGCYEDLERADLLVLVGSNLAWCHPVLFQRIKQAKESNHRLKIVVVDPRFTDTCAIADLHLPLASGSDVALFNGLLSYLSTSDAIDQQYVANHTNGFDSALTLAQQDAGNVESVAEKTQLDVEAVMTLFQWFTETDKTVTVFSQGVNQSSHGVDKVNAIINCHLATGRIGREGTGPFSITGQPNAMGGREVGGLANTLACHMNLEDALHREIVSDFWGVPAVAHKQGLKAVELFEAVSRGDIKAIWIMGTNPVVSMPQADKVKQALQACPLVIASDCIADTDTNRCADILLPARGWGEKSGTVTNSERRISRQRNLLIPVGKAQSDWWIISEVAKRMGFSGSFDYQSEAEIFREYASMSTFRNGKGQGESLRDFNISGLADISDQEYESLEPVQWPVLQGVDAAHKNKRFFANGDFFTEDGRAQFISVVHQLPASSICSSFPLLLNTGRIRDQWHTMTRTGLSAKLSAHLPEPFVDLHPETLQRFGLTDGGIARISSRHGKALARVRCDAGLQKEQVFMPIHWNGVVAAQARVDALIGSATDKLSGQPEFKHTPVMVERFDSCSEAVLVVREPVDYLSCDYWARQTLEQGFVYYIADQKPAGELSEYLRQRVSSEPLDVQVQDFADREHNIYRRAELQSNQLIAAYWVSEHLTGEEHEWLGGLLARPFRENGAPVIFRGVVNEELLQGQIVCSCMQVGEKALCRAIEQGQCTLESLQQITQAGTGCGSCVPQIERMLEI